MAECNVDPFEQAAFCRSQGNETRRLAVKFSDQRVVRALLDYAVALEQQASKLEALKS